MAGTEISGPAEQQMIDPRARRNPVMPTSGLGGAEAG
jgi:hypothetical protein